jgi:hypothetical protein
MTSFPATIRRGIICPDPAYAGEVSVAFARFKVDEIVTVTVEKRTKKRTLKQNRRMWKILQIFEALGWEKDEAKTWCCDQFLEPVVREFPDGSRTESTRGTRFLSTVAMGEFMDRIERFLNEKQLWYPDEP